MSLSFCTWFVHTIAFQLVSSAVPMCPWRGVWPIRSQALLSASFTTVLWCGQAPSNCHFNRPPCRVNVKIVILPRVSGTGGETQASCSARRRRNLSGPFMHPIQAAAAGCLCGGAAACQSDRCLPSVSCWQLAGTYAHQLLCHTPRLVHNEQLLRDSCDMLRATHTSVRTRCFRHSVVYNSNNRFQLRIRYHDPNQDFFFQPLKSVHREESSIHTYDICDLYF